MGSYTSADLIPLIYAHFAFIVVPAVITGAYAWWTGFREDENQVYSNEIDIELMEEVPIRKAA
ncbi:MAG: hypothetical protein ACXWQO_04310 [Bdellovibrionota bacterium]